MQPLGERTQAQAHYAGNHLHQSYSFDKTLFFISYYMHFFIFVRVRF